MGSPRTCSGGVVKLSEYWQGFVGAFAMVAALGAVLALIWLVVNAWPAIVWWTVKRLPLAPAYRRDNSAAVVGGARKAWCLRIPYGVRIIVALGGTREEHEAYAEIIASGRRQQCTTTGSYRGDHVQS